MQVQGFTRPQARPTLVSAYIDGRASGIQSPVLDGVDQFEKATDANPDLQVVVDGRRRPDWLNYSLTAGALAVPVAGWVGFTLAGYPHEALAIAGTLAVGSAVGVYSCLGQTFQARSWEHGARYTIGGDNLASPVAKAGPEKLGSLIVENGAKYPGARHVAYLSGHGTREEIVGMKVEEIGEQLAGRQLDGMVLDACLTNQLEVLSKLAPWAGVVLASTHVVPAKGLPIQKMFAPEVLNQADESQVFSKMAEVAAPATYSFSAIDTRVLKTEVFPKLDHLGRRLAEELRQGHRTPIRRALRRGQGFISSRVDLGRFLTALEQAPLSDQTQKAAGAAREAFEKSLLYQKNEHNLSFDLGEADDQSLEPGWREFLQEYDRRNTYF